MHNFTKTTLGSATLVGLILGSAALHVQAASEYPVHAKIFDSAVQNSSPAYLFEITHSKEGNVDEFIGTFFKPESREVEATERTVVREGILARYSLDHTAAAERAEVKVMPEGVEFRYLKEGKWKQKWEKTDGPVLVGPQLVDTVLAHWDSLSQGKTFQFRFAVPDRMETIGFRVTHEGDSADGKTTFHYAPSSFFIRQLVTPVVLVFDSKTRQIKSLTGRTFLPTPGKKDTLLTGDFRFGG